MNQPNYCYYKIPIIHEKMAPTNLDYSTVQKKSIIQNSII